MTAVEERDAAPEAPTPPAAADAPVATRACASCGAALLPEQDWCLACGTAAPGRLGRTRPGRGALAVAAATLLLATGAGVTAYAALEDSSARASASPGAVLGASQPGQVAAVPPSYLPGKTNPASPTPDPGTALPSLPQVPSTDLTPSTPSFTPAPVTPVTPTPVTPTPTQTTPQATSSTPSTTSTTPQADGTDGSGDDGATPVQLDATPLTLASDPAARYPADANDNSNDPNRATDGDPATRWTVPTETLDPQVGLQINLPTDQRVQALRFTTTSPGFRAEIYVADGSLVPPSITDTRWTHVADVKSAKSGTQDVVFPRNGQVVRHLVIWVTRPPAQRDSVSIDDVQLLKAK